MRSMKFGMAAVTGLMFSLAICGASNAQGFSDFTKFLGGGSGSGHAQNSNQPDAAVNVQRSAPPFMGTFSGKQTTGAGTDEVNTKVACYPAEDPAFEQTRTFVCYAADSSAQNDSHRGQRQSDDE